MSSGERIRSGLQGVGPVLVPAVLLLTVGGTVGAALIRGHELPVPQSPPEGTRCEERQVRLVWHAAPGEGPYAVEVARDAGFRQMEVRSASPGPSLLLPPLPPGRRYHWRVRRGEIEGPAASFEVPRHPVPF